MAKNIGAAMKAVGRNMARANQQKSSGKAPAKFAAGGPVGGKMKMGTMNGLGSDKSGFGSGTARGGGAAGSKGSKFSGTF